MLMIKRSFYSLLFIAALGLIASQASAQSPALGTPPKMTPQMEREQQFLTQAKQAQDAAYAQLGLALQKEPENMVLLKKAESAWVKFFVLDISTVIAWPRQPGEDSVDSPLRWQEELVKSRTRCLQEQLSILRGSNRNKTTQSTPARIRLIPILKLTHADVSGYTKADDELNKSYRQLITLLKPHPDTIDMLKRAELAWIKYRDLDSSLTAALACESTASDQGKRQYWLKVVTEERNILLERMFANLPEDLKKKVRPPWPHGVREIDEDKEFRRVQVQDLPPGIDMEFGIETLEPEEMANSKVYLLDIDLNFDGIPEVIGRYRGGHGGSNYTVYQKRQGKFEKIGDILGFGLRLLTKENGYYQIETLTKSSAHDDDSALYRYVDGQYRLVRLDHSTEEKGYINTVYPSE